MSNSGKATLENSIKGDIDLELIGGTEQLTTTGKNLFDIKKASDVSNYITTETLAKIDITAAIVFDVKKNTNYCLSVSGKTDQPSINFNIANDVQRKSILNKLKTEETLNSLDSGKIYVGFSGGDTELNATKLSQEYFDIQLEEASSKTPYEPYTGLKPSPSPEYPQEIKNVGKWNDETQKYEVDVKVTGKNRFNREKAKDVSNWISIEGDGYLKFPIRVKKGSMITFSYTEKLTEGKKFYLGIAKKETGSVISWLYYDTNLSISNSKYTIAAEEDYVYLMCNRSAIQTFLDVIKTLQVEISQTQTEYEPYQEPQTLTLTSDRPITKWDKLEKRNSVYGILYGSKHVVLNGGEEDWVKSSIDNAFYLKSFEGLLNSYEIFCDKLKNFRGAVNVIELNCILANRTNLYIRIDGITDIGTLKTWLSENNLEVYYNSKESQFIPLPESEQAQLRNLHSYNGTTNITVDSGEVPCGIKVAYKQKK